MGRDLAMLIKDHGVPTIIVFNQAGMGNQIVDQLSGIARKNPIILPMKDGDGDRDSFELLLPAFPVYEK